jgi:hypothetical protein
VPVAPASQQRGVLLDRRASLSRLRHLIGVASGPIRPRAARYSR